MQDSTGSSLPREVHLWHKIPKQSLYDFYHFQERREERREGGRDHHISHGPTRKQKPLSILVSQEPTKLRGSEEVVRQPRD